MSSRDFDEYLQGVNFDIAFDTEEDWNQAVLAENSYFAAQHEGLNYDYSQCEEKSNMSNSKAQAGEASVQINCKVSLMSSRRNRLRLHHLLSS